MGPASLSPGGDKSFGREIWYLSETDHYRCVFYMWITPIFLVIHFHCILGKKLDHSGLKNKIAFPL
jgi:hypothetical protein